MEGKVMLAIYAAFRYAGVNVTSPGKVADREKRNLGHR
jgi:hypothetical protein